MKSLNVRLGFYAHKLKGKQAWWCESSKSYLLNATDDDLSSVMDNFPKICFGDIYVYLLFKKKYSTTLYNQSQQILTIFH
jgi:hypothetical protein